MIAPSPLLGFNNNVKHKGKVFHIQTEDSGVKHPHIITHLFADGGRILKSQKTSYAEHLGDEEMAKIVRGMMKEQHKAMFIALRAGEFDERIDPTGEFAKLGKDGKPNKPGETTTPDAKPTPAKKAPAEPAPARAASVPAAPAPAVAVSPGQPDAAPEEAGVSLGERDTLLDPVEYEPTASRPPTAPPAAAKTTTLEPDAGLTPPPQAPAVLPAIPAVVVPVSIGMGPRATGPRPNVTRPMLPQVDPAAAKEAQKRARISTRPDSSSPGSTRPGSRGPKSTPLSRPLAPDMPMAPIEEYDAGIELDLDALERAAHESQSSPVIKEIKDLPPPPASVIGAKKGKAPADAGTSYRSVTPPSHGSYRSVTPPSSRPGRRRSSRPPDEESEPPASRRSRPTPREGSRHETPRQDNNTRPAGSGPGRYAPSRPASIFGSDRPNEGASIFGEELISEKSLDEVILGYLAEDLEGPQKKK